MDRALVLIIEIGRKSWLWYFDKAVVLMDDESKTLWEINPVCIESVNKIKGDMVICGLDKNGKKVKLNAEFSEIDSAKKLKWLI